VLLLLFVAGTLGVWLGRESLVRRIAEKSLLERLGVPVTIGQVDLGWAGGIRAREVAIFGLAGLDGPPLLTIDEVHIELESLLSLEVQELVLHRPALQVVERQDGTYELVDVLALTPPPEDLPAMRMQECRLELRGKGPLLRSLREWLQPREVYRVDSPVLNLRPIDGRQFSLLGKVDLEGLVPLELEARACLGEGLEDLSLRIDRRQPLELDSEGIRSWVSDTILAGLEREGAEGPVAGTLVVIPSAEDARDRWQLSLDLLGVCARPADFPYPLREVHGEVLVDAEQILLQDLTCVRDSARMYGEGVIDDPFGTAKAQVTVRVDGGRVDEALRHAVGQIDVGKQAIEALQPGGQFSLVCDLNIEAGKPAQVRQQLQLLDAVMRFRGFETDSGDTVAFPLSLERLRGSLEIWDEGFRFSQLAGFTKTGGAVQGDGEWDDALGSLWLHIRGESIELDDEFLEALTEIAGEGARDWFVDLGLSGVVDLDVAIKDSLTEPTRYRIEVWPREVLLHPIHFPFPVRLDAGSMVIDPGTVALHKLHGRACQLESLRPGSDANPTGLTDIGTTVEIEGEISLVGEEPSFEVVIRGHEVVLDERLRMAMDPLSEGKQDVLWDKLSPTGLVDVSFSWKRTQPGASPRIAVDVLPVDLQLNPAPFPLLENVVGLISLRVSEASGAMVLLPKDGLRCAVLGGAAMLRGIATVGSGGRFSLNLEGLKIDDSFFRALRRTEPSAAEFLVPWRPHGWLQAQCEVFVQGGSFSIKRLEIAPDRALAEERGEGIRFDLPFLPAPLNWRSGWLVGDLQAQELQFDGLHGSIRGSDINLEGGSVQWGANGTSLELGAELRSVPPTAWLFPFLSPESRERMGTIRPEGLTDAKVERLFLDFPPGASVPSVARLLAEVDLNRCGIELPARLQDLTGRLNLDVRYEGEGLPSFRNLALSGSLSDVAFKMGSKQEKIFLSGIAGLFSMELGSGLMVIPAFEAEFAGGRFRPQDNHLKVWLDGSGAYEGKLSLEDADLNRLFGENNPTTRDWQGRVDAHLDFHGARRLSNIRGAGTVQVRDGQLWSIPVFDRLYQWGISRSLGQTEQPKVERGSAELQLRGEYVRVRNLEMEGPGLLLSGEGYLGRELLDIRLFSEVKIGWPIIGPVTQKLLSWLGWWALSFRFFGPYLNAYVEWSPVNTRLDPEQLDRPRVSERRPLGPRF
jgi:hypothetical protein